MNLEESAKRMGGAVCRTAGDGFWSSAVRDVVVSHVEVDTNKFDMAGKPKTERYLRVYFHPSTWNIMDDGLVYTDRGWLRDFRKAMRKAGYHSASKINYTEQGMQGEKYVHLIVGVW